MIFYHWLAGLINRPGITGSNTKTPLPSSSANRNVPSILQKRKKNKTELYNNLLLSNTTLSFHPSTVYHITQPTEAHTPQTAADPGSGPNTAGQKSLLDNKNSRTSAPAYTVSSPYYHTDPDHHIP